MIPTAGTAEGDLETIEEDLKLKEPKDAAGAAKVNPIPEGHGTVTPYITVRNANRAIEFYKEAFGATETFRMDRPDGRIGHAEIRIGNSFVMLSDEFPEHGAIAPETYGGSPVRFYVYVEDVDAFVKKAVARGAKEVLPVTNQFYGDRSGQLRDPFGHVWWVATQVELVHPEELKKRAEAAAKE